MRTAFLGQIEKPEAIHENSHRLIFLLGKKSLESQKKEQQTREKIH